MAPVNRAVRLVDRALNSQHPVLRAGDRLFQRIFGRPNIPNQRRAEALAGGRQSAQVSRSQQFLIFQTGGQSSGGSGTATQAVQNLPHSMPQELDAQFQAAGKKIDTYQKGKVIRTGKPRRSLLQSLITAAPYAAMAALTYFAPLKISAFLFNLYPSISLAMLAAYLPLVNLGLGILVGAAVWLGLRALSLRGNPFQMTGKALREESKEALAYAFLDKEARNEDVSRAWKKFSKEERLVISMIKDAIRFVTKYKQERVDKTSFDAIDAGRQKSVAALYLEKADALLGGLKNVENLRIAKDLEEIRDECHNIEFARKTVANYYEDWNTASVSVPSYFNQAKDLLPHLKRVIYLDVYKGLEIVLDECGEILDADRLTEEYNQAKKTKLPFTLQNIKEYRDKAKEKKDYLQHPDRPHLNHLRLILSLAAIESECQNILLAIDLKVEYDQKRQGKRLLELQELEELNDKGSKLHNLLVLGDYKYLEAYTNLQQMLREIEAMVFYIKDIESLAAQLIEARNDGKEIQWIPDLFADREQNILVSLMSGIELVKEYNDKKAAKEAFTPGDYQNYYIRAHNLLNVLRDKYSHLLAVTNLEDLHRNTSVLSLYYSDIEKLAAWTREQQGTKTGIDWIRKLFSSKDLHILDSVMAALEEVEKYGIGAAELNVVNSLLDALESKTGLKVVTQLQHMKIALERPSGPAREEKPAAKIKDDEIIKLTSAELEILGIQPGKKPKLVGASGVEYTVEKQIGAGGMGVTFRARNPRGIVAIKTMPIEEIVLTEKNKIGRGKTENEAKTSVISWLIRFHNEYEFGTKLTHPNSARMIDSNIHDSIPNIEELKSIFRKIPEPPKGAEQEEIDRYREAKVMAKHARQMVLNNFNLDEIAKKKIFIVAEYIADKPGSETPAPTVSERWEDGINKFETVLKYFLPVLELLALAHEKNIAHRDLKPDNLLVTEINGQPVVKVIDLGIARSTEKERETRLTKTDQALGTKKYSPPSDYWEAVDQNPEKFKLFDIYAMGLVLYELMAGDPFVGMTEGQIYIAKEEKNFEFKRIHQPVRPIIEKMLSRKCTNNYSSMQEVIEAFQNVNGKTKLAKKDPAVASDGLPTKKMPAKKLPPEKDTSGRAFEPTAAVLKKPGKDALPMEVAARMAADAEIEMHPLLASIEQAIQSGEEARIQEAFDQLIDGDKEWPSNEQIDAFLQRFTAISAKNPRLLRDRVVKEIIELLTVEDV